MLETSGSPSSASSARVTAWSGGGGVCPGHHESAGKHKSGRRRHGNRWLNAALGTAAMAASRTRDRTYLGARYMRLMPRLGKKKALVALEHTLLTAAWHILTNDVPFHDLGGDYYTKHDPERALRRITRQANALGLTVRFEPIEAA